MANTKEQHQAGTKPCDLINLGVITKTFPRTTIDRILHETDKAGKRKRDLPAHVVVYYVIAMTIYMRQSYREILRTLLEGLRSILGMGSKMHVAGKSGISQARGRLGEEPIRRLHDEIVKPIAVKSDQQCTRGAWYRRWRVMGLDGSTLDVADTPENEAAFGRVKAGRGQAAFPQIRFVSLVESGTHVMCASRMGAYNEDEISLARQVLPQMQKGMVCLAGRYFFSYDLWNKASATGADLLWRVKKNLRLPCHKRLPDGSFLSKVYPSANDRRHDLNGIVVRVIEYRLNAVPNAELRYRLITTILDWRQAPAQELAALHHRRWEVEISLDELKTHLRGADVVLRSKRPDLVRQEFYGFMMAHFAVRGLMHEAALQANIDTDELSFIHAVHVIQRKMIPFSAFSPSATPCIA